METACMKILGDGGFKMLGCYDYRYLQEISIINNRTMTKLDTIMGSTTTQALLTRDSIVGTMNVTMEP